MLYSERDSALRRAGGPGRRATTAGTTICRGRHRRRHAGERPVLLVRPARMASHAMDRRGGGRPGAARTGAPCARECHRHYRMLRHGRRPRVGGGGWRAWPAGRSHDLRRHATGSEPGASRTFPISMPSGSGTASGSRAAGQDLRATGACTTSSTGSRPSTWSSRWTSS